MKMEATVVKKAKKTKKKAGESIGEALRGWRKKRRWSQSVASLNLRVSVRTLQEWEQGRAEPRGLARLALCRLLQLGPHLTAHPIDLEGPSPRRRKPFPRRQPPVRHPWRPVLGYTQLP